MHRLYDGPPYRLSPQVAVQDTNRPADLDWMKLRVVRSAWRDLPERRLRSIIMPLLFVLALFGAVIPHGSPLFLRMAGRTMPKQPADPATSDQDAFFVRHDLQSFAVADGGAKTT